MAQSQLQKVILVPFYGWYILVSGYFASKIENER
jgi:hypothetical protein